MSKQTQLWDFARYMGTPCCCIHPVKTRQPVEARHPVLGQYKPVERGANGSLAMLASSLDRGLGKPVKMSRAILATISSLEMLPAVGPVRGCMASTVLSNRSLSCQEMHTSSGLSYSSMQCNSFMASSSTCMPPEDIDCHAFTCKPGFQQQRVALLALGGCQH